jgi:hypothetical protein
MAVTALAARRIRVSERTTTAAIRSEAMSDINANIPLPAALAIVSAIYWPITLGLIGAPIVSTARSNGAARLVCAATALVLVIAWLAGLCLLHE